MASTPAAMFETARMQLATAAVYAAACVACVAAIAAPVVPLFLAAGLGAFAWFTLKPTPHSARVSVAQAARASVIPLLVIGFAVVAFVLRDQRHLWGASAALGYGAGNRLRAAAMARAAARQASGVA